MPERTIYEQLTGVTVDDATVEQLDFTRNTFIDAKSIEYWRGVITISKILEASRTYPHGLPIPSASTIVQVVITAGDNQIIHPQGSEIWRITSLNLVGIGGASTISIANFDGSTRSFLKTGITTSASAAAPTIIGAYGAVSDVEVLSLPLLVDNTVYIELTETGGAQDCILTYSYQKVSL